jgi:hypothetical protein
MLPLLSLVLLVLLSGCGLADLPTHTTYSFSTFSGLPPERKTDPNEPAYQYRLGERIDLAWPAQKSATTTDQQPQSIKIEAGLVGPYTSLDDLKRATGFDNNVVSGQMITSISPIQTNNWSSKTVASTLSLPTSLAPGYYLLVQRIQLGKHPAGLSPTGSIINVLK